MGLLLLARWLARCGQHGVGAAGPTVGSVSPRASLSLTSQVSRGNPGSCLCICPVPGSARLGGGSGARPARCPRPEVPTRPRTGGLGWRTAGRESAPRPALAANWALREGEGGKTLCVFQVAVVGARISNLLSREGNPRVRLSRGRGNGGTEGARATRLSGGSEPLRVEKAGCRARETRLCPVWTEASRVRVAGASGALPGAGSLWFGSAAFSSFRSSWPTWLKPFFFTLGR